MLTKRPLKPQRSFHLNVHHGHSSVSRETARSFQNLCLLLVPLDIKVPLGPQTFYKANPKSLAFGIEFSFIGHDSAFCMEPPLVHGIAVITPTGPSKFERCDIFFRWYRERTGSLGSMMTNMYIPSPSKIVNGIYSLLQLDHYSIALSGKLGTSFHASSIPHHLTHLTTTLITSSSKPALR